MKQTYNYNFYCRTQKANKYGLSPIELCISINGKRTYITLPYKCSNADFTKAMESKRNNEIKTFVHTFQSKLQSTIATLVANNEQITTATVKQALIHGYSTIYTVQNLFEEYLHILRNRKDITIPNLRKYEMAYEIFTEVVEPSKELNKVTNADILKYQANVYNRFKESTAASYLTKLKTFFKFAKNNNRLTTDPFSGIKISKPKEKIEIISKKDYIKLHTANLDGRLDRTRDFLILMANCGLAFADLQSIKADDIIVVNGLHTITKRRIKTDIQYNSVILQDGVEILEKYNYNISPLFISNSKTNKYAKELQDILEIHSVPKLHTHLMRHYYITSLIRKGVDISVVKLCAGHSNIKMTEKYTHLQIEDVVDNIMQHI